MSYDAQLCQTIKSLGLRIEPNLDTSTHSEYLVYGYTSEGALFGDDVPCIDHRRWELVYVVPVSVNRISVRRSIREAILKIFGVWPSEEDVSDASGQRYLFCFETIGGIDDGEPGHEQQHNNAVV